MMDIGIIVHTKSGATARFAELIAAKLREKGHKTDLVRLATDVAVNFGSVRRAPPFKITNLPDGSGYDVILVGGPVWAFSASPVVSRP